MTRKQLEQAKIDHEAFFKSVTPIHIVLCGGDPYELINSVMTLPLQRVELLRQYMASLAPK